MIEIKAANWKTVEKNTLRGFVDLILPQVDLRIREVACHRDGDRAWVSLPAKPWTRDDGTTAWKNIIDHTSDEGKAVFQSAALAAIRTLRKATPK